MDKKLIYYRPDFSNAELLSPENAKLLEKLYGKNRPYNRIETLAIDENFDTGLPIVSAILMFMQCDRRFNEKEEQLRERISRGLTRSNGKDSQYGSMSEFVEQNLLFKLISDAREQYRKEGGEVGKCYDVPYKEFFRLFNLPFTSITKKMQEHNNMVKDIPKPVKLYNIKGISDGFANDQNSVFKCHTIKARLSTSVSKRDVYAKFPYLGKIHQSMFGEGNMQLNVYDYAHRNWAAQNVIHYLIENGYVRLNSKELFF